MTAHPQELPYSGITVASYYEGWVNIRAHRVILGQHWGEMDDMADALNEAFASSNEALQKTIALSGLRQYVASLSPTPGGTGYDREKDRHYLTTARDIDSGHLPLWQPQLEGTRGPYHTLLDQRVSVFDFAVLVKHVMTNTELQDCHGKPKDPRLGLIESLNVVSSNVSAS